MNCKAAGLCGDALDTYVQQIFELGLYVFAFLLERRWPVALVRAHLLSLFSHRVLLCPHQLGPR